MSDIVYLINLLELVEVFRLTLLKVMVDTIFRKIFSSAVRPEVP